MYSFRLNNTNKFCLYKQCIICIAFFANSRICWPFSDRHVMTFRWSCAFCITDFLCIGFPAHLTQLFINHIASFNLRLLTLTCHFISLFQTNFLIYLLSLFSTGNSCFCKFFFFFFFLDFAQNDNLLCFLFFLYRHNKILMLVIPVTISLHKPFRQAVCHL